MHLVPGSIVKKDRATARKEMKRRHKSLVLELVGTYHTNKAALNDLAETSDDNLFDPFLPIPMSSSCSTVCETTTQLIRQCLGLELYRGGRLVSEAVSYYFRNRTL